MLALDLLEPDEIVSRNRGLQLDTRVGQMDTALRYYDRNGRLYSCAGLRWAVDCLWNGCELLIARPHLTPANLRATPRVKAHIALAEGALGGSKCFPRERLHRELEALQKAVVGYFLTWLATPGRCQAQGGREAPRTLASLQARLGRETVERLFPALLRLGGAYKASRPPLERARDMRQLVDALTRSGALQRDRLEDRQADLLLEGLAQSFARVEGEPGRSEPMRGSCGTLNALTRTLRS